MVATLSGLHASELLLLTALVAEVTFLIIVLFPRVDILRLELAGSRSRAQAIVDAWSGEGRLGAARRNVYVDFAFIVAYATLLALTVVLAERAALWSELISKDADEVGIAFVLVALAAGVLDAIENGALLGMLGEHARITAVRARTAQVLALAKLILIAIAVGWSISIPIASVVYRYD